MKVLVCIPHFYAKTSPIRPVEGSSHDSIEFRNRIFLDTVRQWSSLLGKRQFYIGSAGDISQGVNNVVHEVVNDLYGDVFICVSGDDHLLGLNRELNFRTARESQGDPRNLPYLCRKVFLEFRNDYDLFIFVEDDTVAWDPQFLEKIARFYQEFGEDNLILANRYELFSGYAFKVYLEFPSPEHTRIASLPNSPNILVSRDGIHFDRTQSPYMGFYAVTRRQLIDWEKMPFFLAPSLKLGVNELEEAMVPLLGRRPIYRPSKRNINYLEVHHLPNRACHARTPWNNLVNLLEQPNPEV